MRSRQKRRAHSSSRTGRRGSRQVRTITFTYQSDTIDTIDTYTIDHSGKKPSPLKYLLVLLLIASTFFMRPVAGSIPVINIQDVKPKVTPVVTPLPEPATTPENQWQENVRAPIDDQIYLAWDQWRKELDEIPPGINVISPHFFEVVKVGDKSEVKLLSEVRSGWSDWTPASYVETAHEAGVKVWAMVQNMEDYDAAEYIVTTEEGRNHFYTKVKEWIDIYQLDGICLDFEHMNPANSAAYSEFAAGLKQALPASCIVSACVTVKLNGNNDDNWWQCYDRVSLAQSVDYLCVMAYDNHRDNTMEPVAGIQWVDMHVRRLLEEVPSNKLILGVPFYGTDYREEVQDGNIFSTRPMWKDSGWTTTIFNLNSALSNGQYTKGDDTFVVDYWIDKGSWDSEVGISTYSFVDTNGTMHQIWIDDENSLYQKGRLALRYNLGGVAVWKKSLGTTPMWEALLRGITKGK